MFPPLKAASAFLIVLNLSKLAVAENLPFDRTNPFIWDNDGESDCRSLTLCLALDKLGEMNLIGISHAPHPYQNQSEDYQHIVNLARATGWTGLPDATVGLGAFPKHALARPGSGAVHDTAPIDTAPAQMIKNQVLSVGTPAKPVVIGTGGCVTTVASAYLLANQEGRGVEFASKCVLYGVLGWNGSTRLDEYNCYQDPWALYVCIQQLRTYLIQLAPRTPYDTNNLRPFIDALPPSPLGDYMKSIHPGTFDPAFDPGGVIDGGPIFALYFPNQGQYFHQIFPVSFDFWGADVGDNIRNINCHRQIVHVRGDPSSNDRMTFSYDRDEINAWALDVFQRAFQGSTPTPTEATAPTPAPTTTPTPTLTSTPAPGNSVANPSFDADGFDTQTPSGWREWDDAWTSYADTYGGSHSGARHGTHWSSGAYKVWTYQNTSLPNGDYTLQAWVRSSGGQNYCALAAQYHGGPWTAVNISVASDWTLVTLPVKVSSGRIEFGICSFGNPGNWVHFEDISLVPSS